MMPNDTPIDRFNRLVEDADKCACPLCKNQTTSAVINEAQRNMTVYGIPLSELIEVLDWDKVSKLAERERTE